jgi:hypothetical protein
MPAILAITVPFFALVLCGYLAAQFRVLPQSAIPGLNAFVLYFALPCMLFRFGAATPFAQLLDPALLVVYGVCALAMVAFTIAVTLQRSVGGSGVDPDECGLRRAGGGLSEHRLHGRAAARGAAGCGGGRAGDLRRAGRHDRHQQPVHRRRADARPFAGPGAGGGSAAAVALIRSVRGARQLHCRGRSCSARRSRSAAWRCRARSANREDARRRRDAGRAVHDRHRAGARQHARTPTPAAQFVPVALFKLFVHPLLVLAVGLLANAAGLAISELNLTVLVLAAALPSASNVSLLAERFGADNGRIARIIMTSTTIAFVSFSALAWLLGAGAQA